MGSPTQKTKNAHPKDDRELTGHHKQPYCSAAGRSPGPCIEREVLSKTFIGFIEGKFGSLPKQFNALPDTRNKESCRYNPAELIWPTLLMLLTRSGSRNQADANRNMGYLPEAIARLSGRRADDIPDDGQRRVTCSDNAVIFLSNLDPIYLEQMIVGIVRSLVESRMFDSSCVFGKCLRVVIDGSVREKCREGFYEGGKVNGGGRYRYVLQASVLLFGHAIPLMHEHIDVDDPVAEKEDCEINGAKRLFLRLKEAFPRIKFIIIGDALYACRPIAAECVRLGWYFCFTFKQGRTPAVWEEAMKLMEGTSENSLLYHDKPDNTDPDRRDGRVRWVKHIDFSERDDDSLMVTAIEETETFKGCETRYAWISNIPGINGGNIFALISASGRKRHTIEDQFNTQKNNGLGMEHVFCAEATASKNLYSLMQIAHLLWTLFYHGLIKRRYAWAKTRSQIAIAKSLLEGLAVLGGADPDYKVGQLRFVT